MLRASLAGAALTLLAAEPAEACSIECSRVFSLYSPAPDAGEVPTNVQLIATIPTVDTGPTLHEVRLERVDGSDGDGGVRLDGVVVNGSGCGSVRMRLRPSQPLMPNADYRVYVADVDAGAPWSPIEAPTFLFRTAAGPDTSPPAWPTLDQRRYEEASCNSCGTSGGGAGVTFQKSDAVWFAPIETKYRSSGGPSGFFVPFACSGVSPGLAEGVHQMPVIAFDSAWNQSEIAYVELETNCKGIDPCTGERLTQNDTAAPLRGFSGCGCNTSSTIFSLLSAAVLARVLRRSRGWSSSSTSGCWRWGRSASSSSRSRR